MLMKTNVFRLAWDIRHSVWLVSDPDVMSDLAGRVLSRQAVDLDYTPAHCELFAESGRRVNAGEQGKSKSPMVAVVPLHGTMTKYRTCESDGTARLADVISELADDPSVVGMVLDIDSGGGAINSLPPLFAALDRVRSAGKPVYAHCDLCGSAAYWAAIHCDAVYLDNRFSEVGSIGAFYHFVDTRAANPATGEKEITIYAPESSAKNYSYRRALEGDFAPAEKELSRTVRDFQGEVKSRRSALKADAEGVLSGAMFKAADALKVGLADAVRNLDETVQAVFALASIN